MIRLSLEDQRRLKNSAKVAQALENKWVRKFRDTIASYSVQSADQISSGGSIVVPDFEKMFIEHYFDVQIKAITLAENEQELDKRLAKSARSIREILKLYDRWRKGLYKPKGFQRKAESIQKKYISAIQDTWKNLSEDFREGGTQTQEEIKKKVAESTGATEARANTIVRTETTRFYNETRKIYYDKAPNVTHYLFLAVRDKATTPWCRNTTVNGYRGRSGLVYAKDDPLLEKEKPPCHWSCRSELLPLSRFNPTHQKMIADESIQRRNNTCTPLPPGWNK
jgi:SPP1 gp7 family putative phage head morphogenesis protein